MMDLGYLRPIVITIGLGRFSDHDGFERIIVKIE